MKKNNKDTAGNRGFSLIEIIVVIAIMGITLAVSMPSIINYYPHMQLKSTSMQLYAGLQRARSKAVGSTDQYGVQINMAVTPQTHRLMMSTDGGTTWTPDPRSAMQEIPGHTSVFSVNIGGNPLAADNNIIIFRPVGTATEADIEMVNLRGEKDGDGNLTDIYQLCVRQMTGRVRIVAGGGGCV